MGLKDRLQHGWNAFMNKDPTPTYYHYPTAGYSYRPDRPRLTRGNERSIINTVFNKIAIDAASIDLQHCRLDEDERFTDVVKSRLNECLTLEANLDQSAHAFKIDIFMSLFDEGTIAIVPIDTTLDPRKTGSFDIETMRVGRVTEWYPAHVKVNVYNEKTGRKEDIIVPKRTTAIVENPFYSVMNEPSSTLQRLIRKLNILDAIDEQSGSGKLDLIIQLPYSIRSDARREQAEQRTKHIEMQLSDSKYGIAYVDSTEHITQLNRPVENNLMKQIEFLTSMLYSQLGITQSILDGTADEKTMLNYYSRTIEPVIAAVVNEMKRKFLTKTARTQGQSILYFRDHFKLVPVGELAEVADKLTRNEIASSNEIRQKMGWKPSKDPNADKLRNSNLNHPDETQPKQAEVTEEITEEGGKDQNG